MKNFTGLVLCDYRSERVDVHVRADYVDGKLEFSGHDLGPVVEEFFGDDDYEYWYSLEKEEADKLCSRHCLLPENRRGCLTGK